MRLIERLDRNEEMSVQALADELVTTQQNASRHLGVLLQAGMLVRRQEGRLVWYRVSNPMIYRLLEDVGGDILDELRRLPEASTDAN